MWERQAVPVSPCMHVSASVTYLWVTPSCCSKHTFFAETHKPHARAQTSKRFYHLPPSRAQAANALTCCVTPGTIHTSLGPREAVPFCPEPVIPSGSSCREILEAVEESKRGPGGPAGSACDLGAELGRNETAKSHGSHKFT